MALVLYQDMKFRVFSPSININLLSMILYSFWIVFLVKLEVVVKLANTMILTIENACIVLVNSKMQPFVQKMNGFYFIAICQPIQTIKIL